jgi:hypothetical protein
MMGFDANDIANEYGSDALRDVLDLERDQRRQFSTISTSRAAHCRRAIGRCRTACHGAM